MAFQALNISHQRKPTQLWIVWKTSSHPMTCVMKKMNGKWRLDFKLYSNPKITVPPETV
jgi:hypothetical protein